MPLKRLANEAGVYRPDELTLMKRVFDQLAADERDASKREALASRIIGYYMSGMKRQERATHGLEVAASQVIAESSAAWESETCDESEESLPRCQAIFHDGSDLTPVEDQEFPAGERTRR